MYSNKKKESQEKKDNPLMKTWFTGVKISEDAVDEPGSSESSSDNIKTELPGSKYAGSDLNTKSIEKILADLPKIAPKNFIKVAANLINASFQANLSLKEDVKLVTHSTDGIFDYWNSYKNNLLNDYVSKTLLKYIADVNHQHFKDLKLIYNGFKEGESSGAEKVSTSLLIFLITDELNRLLDKQTNIADIIYETDESIALDDKGDIIKIFENLFPESYEEKSSESYNEVEVKEEAKVEFAGEEEFDKEEAESLRLTIKGRKVKTTENTIEESEPTLERNVLSKEFLLEEMSKAREEMSALLCDPKEEKEIIPASVEKFTDLVGKSEESPSEYS